jgi:DivIVA domain-containing protein
MSEPNPSPRPGSDDIRGREFDTARRGYDRDQVRDYLQQVAMLVDDLNRALREAREQAPAEDPYGRLAGRVADVLRSTDEQAEKILHDAREEAARTLGEAREETDRAHADAQSHAEAARREGDEILQNAKEEAARMLSGSSAARVGLVEKMQLMRSRLKDAAQELEVAIDELSDDEPARAASPDAGANESDFPDATSEGSVATQPVGTAPAIEGSFPPEPGSRTTPIGPLSEEIWEPHETIAPSPDDLILGPESPNEG